MFDLLQAAVFFGLYTQLFTPTVGVHPIGEAGVLVCFPRYLPNSTFDKRSQPDPRRSPTYCPHFRRLLFSVQSLTRHDGRFRIFPRFRFDFSTLANGIIFIKYSIDVTIAGSILGAMPFSLAEIRELASTLRDICVGLVELAYPDSRPSAAFNFSKQRSTATRGEDTRLWMHLFKVDTHLFIVHRSTEFLETSSVLRNEAFLPRVWLLSRKSTVFEEMN